MECNITFIIYGEEKGQILDVTFVVLQKHEPTIQLRIKRRQVVKVVDLAQTFTQEKSCKRSVNQDAFIQSLAENTS